jgi:hypothetical protein
LEAANGTAPVNLSLTSYSSSEELFAMLFDTTTGTQTAFTGISSANFSFDASDFTPGQSYQLQVLNSNAADGAYVDGASVSVNYITTTDVNFTAGATPEPSTLVLIVVVGGLFIPIAWKARSRAAQTA